MPKNLIPCEQCNTLHTRRGLRMCHSRLLCYACFVAETVRIPGKYTKSYYNRLKREFKASQKEDEDAI